MFQAPVILWNFDTSQLLSKYDSHKVRVESVTFSCDSKYLISLGGNDDNNIIVWNVEEREAVCCKCHSFLLLVVFLSVFVDGCKVSNLFHPSSPITIQYNTLQCNTLHYITIHYNTIQYITIQYITIQYITLQCNTLQYNTLQYTFHGSLGLSQDNWMWNMS